MRSAQPPGAVKGAPGYPRGARGVPGEVDPWRRGRLGEHRPGGRGDHPV